LSTDTRHRGTAVFSVVAVSGKDTLCREPLPHIIRNKRKLHILMLQSEPNFEYSFLRNYLKKEAHSLSIRNRISKDKFHTEQYHLAGKFDGNLSKALLSLPDLLITDVRE